MAQTNLLGAVPASSGYNVRVNLNAADEALASENEGAGAPAQTWPHMAWRDHAAGRRYRRNAGNTAWEIIENYAAAADPGSTDDAAAGYVAGARWINTTDNRVFVCTDAATGAAVWHTADTSGRIGSGTAFPGSPAEGDAVYRTDLDALFVYDATRSKWLGALESDGGGYSGDLAQNTYMRRFNGSDFSASNGILIPCDATIVGLSACWTTARTATLRVHRSGVVVSTAGDGSSVTQIADFTLDDDFAAGGILAFSTTGHTSPTTSIQLRCWWRRRAS
ncbi:MAG: hypothetical protein JNM75_08490 [Rhodospirillales bacterium]|nr:hypothetical protein [Rhodospirillales bacterium]